MPRTTQRRVYIATETFMTDEGAVMAGVTRVRDGHPLVKTYPEWFSLLEDLPVHFEFEAATQGPGEQRGDQ